jgi:hypothetical protein
MAPADLFSAVDPRFGNRHSGAPGVSGLERESKAAFHDWRTILCRVHQKIKHSRWRNVRRTLPVTCSRQGASPMSNPKTEPNDNTKKDPDEWVSGDDPMTGAQASYLKTLCEQAGTPEAYDDNLTKAEASKLIDAMRQQAGVN